MNHLLLPGPQRAAQAPVENSLGSHSQAGPVKQLYAGLAQICSGSSGSIASASLLLGLGQVPGQPVWFCLPQPHLTPVPCKLPCVPHTWPSVPVHFLPSGGLGAWCLHFPPLSLDPCHVLIVLVAPAAPPPNPPCARMLIQLQAWLLC